MKGLFTGMLLGLTTLAMAQKSNGTLTMDVRENMQISMPKIIDTVLTPPIAAACVPNAAIGILSLGPDFVSGANSFGDKEKAQHYVYAGGGNITGVLVIYGAKRQGAAAGASNFNVKLYASVLSGPGTFLGTSTPVGYASIDTTGAPTYFNFPTPVAVIDSFYASVVVDPGLPTACDTTAIFTVFDASNPTNICGRGTAWERQGDNTWHKMNGSGPTEWGVDIQYLILPIISTTSGPVGIDETSPLTTHKMYPNPASEMINLSYQLNTSTDVQINVTDLSGKVIYTANQPSQFSGAYNKTIDVSGYASGLYTYSIQTGNHVIVGKFIVE